MEAEEVNSVPWVEVGVALLLGVVVTLLASLLLYAYARLVIWWRNRRPPVVFVEKLPRWEHSDRERQGSSRRSNGRVA